MADKQQIIEDLSRKYKVSTAQIEKAVNSQFKFAKQQMEQDHMPSIRIPYFGVFKPDRRKVKHINENYKKKHGISRSQRQQTAQQSKEESKEES